MKISLISAYVTSVLMALVSCSSPSALRPSFTISIAAANVSDPRAAVALLAEELGIEPVRIHDDWAMLVHDTAAPGAMSFEFFSIATWPGRRVGDSVQAFVPRFAVYTGEQFSTGPGMRKFRVTNQLVVDLPSQVASTGARIVLMGLDLTCADLDAQLEFYSNTLGLDRHSDAGSISIRSPGTPGPTLRLRPGSTRPRPKASDLGDASTWLSIEAPDIDQAEAWLRDSGVEVLQGQKFHLGVMLTDLIVADADGNPIQIVEYHGPVSWRNAARRMLFGREH